MAVTQFSSGQKLRAARLNEIITYTTRLSIEKQSDTARTSTTSRTADPELTLNLAASITYRVTLRALLTSAANAAGDFSFDLTFPTGATASGATVALDLGLASSSVSSLVAGAVANTASPFGTFAVGCSTTLTQAILICTVEMSTTAGALAVSWAQQASNANATTLKAGSWLEAVPVG